MKRRWRRILWTLGIVVVVSFVYAWFFGFQTMMILETRWIARKSPIVRETPRALPDTSISPAHGTKLSYFGYDFEVPWDDLDLAQSKTQSNPVVLRFRSGRSLMFSSSPPRHFVDAVSKEMGQLDGFRGIYGDAPLQSDYAFWSMILAATPDQVNLFSSRKEIVGNSMLLVMKGVALPQRSGIFRVQTQGFKGFQWGDPKADPTHVVADLFADDCGLEFVFFGKTKKNPESISQAEINRVLQTVHKTEHIPSQAASRPKLVANAE